MEAGAASWMVASGARKTFPASFRFKGEGVVNEAGRPFWEGSVADAQFARTRGEGKVTSTSVPSFGVE